MKSCNIVITGVLIGVLTIGGWFFFIRPTQEFDDELKYYIFLANENSDIINLEISEGSFEECKQISWRLFFKRSKLELRIIIQEEIEQVEYYKVRIVVDPKAKTIFLDNWGIIEYWTP